MVSPSKTNNPNELLDKLGECERESQHIKLLLDRQYVKPFKRMTAWEVEGVKLNF